MKKIFTYCIMLSSFCFFISCSKDVKIPANKVVYIATATSGATTQGGTCSHTCPGSSGHTTNGGGF